MTSSECSGPSEERRAGDADPAARLAPPLARLGRALHPLLEELDHFRRPVVHALLGLLGSLALACAGDGGPVAPGPPELGHRPNPARFYTKIGGDADFWDRSGSLVRDDVARFNDVVFIGEPLDQARSVAAELRSRAAAADNTGLRILRYWNMWSDYNPGGEARYTDRMYLYQNWPDTNPATRGAGIASLEDDGCRRLLDVSSPELRTEIARVVSGFRDDFDGVFFDRSGWDVYARKFRAGGLALSIGLSCISEDLGIGFSTRFIPSSADFAVAYHAAMHRTIDPAGTRAKLQICNGLPRRADQADAFHESAYFGVVDGCQMDTAFVDDRGSRIEGSDWLFELETLRRFAEAGHYFLTKIQWSSLPEPLRTNGLDYGFASYLLGADGRFALFMPAYGFTDWATDPMVSAPLGDSAGPAQPVAGAGGYVYLREFEHGLVIVNADGRPHDMAPPAGTYRDARTGASVSGSLSLDATTGKILIKISS